jgi:ABC-type uncharacterized transport system YnjBCD ATPase subunit
VKPDIEIHIDELTLDGFDLRDSARIGQAVEAELARLFALHAEPVSLLKNINYSKLDAGTLTFTAGSKATSFGNQIASSVFKGINTNNRFSKK